MSIFWWVVIITAIAGIGGTGLGGGLGAVLERDSARIVSLLLAFAGGIMLAVVTFELIPESFLPVGATEEMPVLLVLFGIAFGFGAIYLLNYIIDNHINPEISHIDASHPATADDLDELIHADHLKKHTEEGDRHEMFIAGIVMACAIALHNIPEGMVIGASYAGDAGDIVGGAGFIIAIVIGLHNIPEGMVIGASYAGDGGAIVGGAGFIIAIVIGLHNIPEGMSVSVPLITGGMTKSKAIFVTAMSGATTVIGAVLGLWIGLISPVWLSLSLSFAGGAMLYVVLGELLPEAFLMWKSKAPGAMTLFGILLGLVLIHV